MALWDVLGIPILEKQEHVDVWDLLTNTLGSVAGTRLVRHAFMLTFQWYFSNTERKMSTG